MRKLMVAAALAAAAGLGQFAFHDTTSTHADAAPFISNIGVGVSGRVVWYDLCARGRATPAQASVVVADAHGRRYQVNLHYAHRSCGAATYLMSGTFVHLPTGTYHFESACVLLSDGTLLPCLGRDTGLSGLAAGHAVIRQCRVDFTVGRRVAPRDCTGPGVLGHLPRLEPARRLPHPAHPHPAAPTVISVVVGAAPATSTPRPTRAVPLPTATAAVSVTVGLLSAAP